MDRTEAAPAERTNAEAAAPALPRRTATLVSLALVLVALPFFALTFVYAGAERWPHALDQVMNDPGKSLFHLLLLPCAVWLFLATFPKAAVEAMRRDGRARALAALVAAFGLITVVWVTWDDAQGRLKSGLSSAIELKHPRAVDLMDFESELRQRMADRTAGETESLKAEYLAEVQRLIGDPAELSVPTSVNALTLYGMVLSLIGAGAVVFMLLAYLLAHFTHTMDTRTNEAFLMVIGLLVPWLLLRAYSEWYALFGDVDLFVDYTPFVPALVLSVIGIFFCYLSRQRSRRPIVIAAGVMAAVPGILSLVGAVSPGFAATTARVFYSTPLSTKVIVYAGIALVVLGFGLTLYPQRQRGADRAAGRPAN